MKRLQRSFNLIACDAVNARQRMKFNICDAIRDTKKIKIWSVSHFLLSLRQVKPKNIKLC